jgi:hypothetical protein
MSRSLQRMVVSVEEAGTTGIAVGTTMDILAYMTIFPTPESVLPRLKMHMPAIKMVGCPHLAPGSLHRLILWESKAAPSGEKRKHTYLLTAPNLETDFCFAWQVLQTCYKGDSREMGTVNDRPFPEW